MDSADPLRPKQALASLVEGAFLLLEGARFIRRERRLWALALVPVGFALVGLGGATVCFWFWAGSIHEGWVELLPIFEADLWWHWLWVGPGRATVWLISWVAVLATFALSLVAGLLLANILSAPFLDSLSQRVEAIESGGNPASEAGIRVLLKESVASFAAETQRVGFFLAIWIGLGLLGFVIPGGQLITGPMLIALTIFFLPLDFAGFALDRRGLSFRDRRRWLYGNRLLMLGFGGIAFFACLIPGLNLVMLPAQVTAGTLLVMRRAPDA